VSNLGPPLGEDKNAVLLVRVWLEDDEDTFRARLTSMGRASHGGLKDMTVAVAASPRDVVDAVSIWLEQFIRDAASAVDGEE
jgi:hypothetical protein